ncbi:MULTISPECIES: hypothetical protein [unclassified Pseudoalteromonas]|uniref:hypothetical protein n=1 Tax=unclassified Pseudoalteromonas TaxID=194690 RepID=UPI0020979DEB|nr:hypothetical protein [Pseudoalteromonas sp. XMcav2-N]MCO7191245.1 hypothetical protein [Pseudoalteromonas sp. XMcav2-N]
MKKLFLVFVALCLFGCSSIPLSTMLKYRNFDEQSFTALNPSQIRSKVKVSKPFTLNMEKMNLSLSLENEKGISHFTFPLILEKQGRIDAQEGFILSEPAKTEYTFRLSELAVNNFLKTQNLLSQEVQQKISFSIGAGFNEKPQERQTVHISISLQLDDKEGYFTLIDEAEVELGQDG